MWSPSEQGTPAHQCARCLGTHPLTSCPHTEAPQLGWVKRTRGSAVAHMGKIPHARGSMAVLRHPPSLPSHSKLCLPSSGLVTMRASRATLSLGYHWSQQLDMTFKDCIRSVNQGLGCSARSEPIDLLKALDVTWPWQQNFKDMAWPIDTNYGTAHGRMHLYVQGN